MKIALIQLNSIWQDIKTNIQQAENFIQQTEKADLYILPEMWATGFCTADAKDASLALHWMERIAKESLCAIAGSLPISKENGKFANRFYFVTPTCSSFYDKHHLFCIGGEDKEFEAGQERTIVHFGEFRFLLQICYDLRFPVFSRNANTDYDAIIYVACWPASRKLALDSLLIARAIENQCYVICVNRTGKEKTLRYDGGSCIISPEGKRLLDLGCSPNIQTTDISIEELNSFRQKYPFLQDADAFQLF
ncbi:nitrilase-related carbon-nitrogen hydrolase [Alloprevotella rava]|uniref:Putative amidohydrolase n=1 Tax=Alloprevotella rava TaxID=671218 RepID=A0A7W5UKE2_9BACT|nr:nitrilase-related carbon-nitrogen hydrolase [Alloprevotella rava]MBB3703123.1 putative amidohydrolase [Alloprevotella rava]